MKSILLCLIALAMNSCNAGPIMGEVRVWIEPNTEFTMDEAVQLCNHWSPVGVECAATSCPGDSNTIVDVVPFEDNTATGVTVDTSIHINSEYQTNHETFRIALAHEYGHLIGLHHIPSTCNEPHVFYCGMPICGPALMNPSVDYWGKDTLSDIDILYYAATRNIDCDSVGQLMLENTP